MEILKYGKKALVNNSDKKAFKCNVCGCLWVAEPEEYFMIRTPINPNTYSLCPYCGTKTWYSKEVEEMI